MVLPSPRNLAGADAGPGDAPQVVRFLRYAPVAAVAFGMGWQKEGFWSVACFALITATFVTVARRRPAGPELKPSLLSDVLRATPLMALLVAVVAEVGRLAGEFYVTGSL